MEYNLFADALNKFSQVTPFIQAVIVLSSCGMMLGFAYFIKECVVSIMKPFTKYDNTLAEKKGEKPEWKDKYYRE